MKTYRGLVAFFLMLAMAGSAYSFDSSDYYWYGRDNPEHTMGVVAQTGAAVTAGQWVAYSFTDEQGLETGAVVEAVAEENSARILGVAETGGDTGAHIRIITRGYTTAFIQGGDSGATGIVNGTVLTSSLTRGAAGSAAMYMTDVAGAGFGGDVVTTAQLALTRIVGISCGAVAATDTAATTRYPVIVLCR